MSSHLLRRLRRPSRHASQRSREFFNFLPRRSLAFSRIAPHRDRRGRPRRAVARARKRRRARPGVRDDDGCIAATAVVVHRRRRRALGCLERTAAAHARAVAPPPSPIRVAMRGNLVGVVTHRARVSIDVVVARARQKVRELRAAHRRGR